MSRQPLRHPLLIAIAVALAPASLLNAQGAERSERIRIEAAGAAGVVTGRVREAGGVGLAGAVVRIGDRQVVTDRDGVFRFANVPAGEQSLSIDYVGYQPLETTFEVGANAGLRAELTLVSTLATGQFDAIEVRASRDAQALALNQQRSSGNYVNVVSADLLGRFPDANVAESTQRIPGVSISRDQGEGRFVNVRGAPPEFTKVSVDGVNLSAPNAFSRAVELDTIPPDAVAAMEVTKALTPDMDGDAIAGTINLVTQSALDRDGPILRASVGAGQYELESGENTRVSASAGGQFGTAGNLGLLLSVSGSRVGRLTDNIETTFFRADDGRLLPELTEIKDYDGERTRTGVTLRGDARLSEDHLLYAVLGNSKFRDKEYRNTLSITYERHSADASDIGGVAGRATFDKEIRERIQEQRIRTANVGGEHYFSDWNLDWQADYSQGKLDLPARQQFIYRNTVRPAMRYDYSNPDFPTFTLLNSNGSVLQEGVNLAESSYAFRRYNQRFEQADESEFALRLDLQREQSFIGDAGTVQFGLRSRLREKDSNDDRNRNGVVANGPAYATLLCDRIANNFGRYPFGRVFCNDVFTRFGGNVQNANLLPLVADSIVSDYRADEDILAGYVRLDAEWDNGWSMIAGVRFEQTDTAGDAFRFDADSLSAVPVSVDRDYNDVLPSLHLRYEVTPDTIFRASVSTALFRPNYFDTVPRVVVSDDDREAEAGNPDLKATYSRNFDVSIERYLRPLGLLSAAFFYKDLDDPIFIASSEQVGGPFDGFDITRPENGESGSLQGLELAWQQTFDQLPAPFDGLGVYANYTYTESDAELPFGIGSTELPGTSRHNYNFALSYEKHKINARIAYNYRSEYIQEFAVGDPDLNVFWDAREIVDFSSSYEFAEQWQVFADVNNITNSRQRRFQGVSSRVLELEEFGRYWLVGLRFKY